ncbi:hypothetical protein B7939_01385 [Eggerthia catenaformis]|nr:hypothetical protein B7939_01385 [Eggerthia catenaformis]
MILNTGNRTDIPAFFSEWFMQRIKAGYVYTRNPYNPQMIISYKLNPDLIDLMTFCTKNPIPMLKYMDDLKVYRMFWHITLTCYGEDIEPFVPNKNRIMDAIKKLSEYVDKKAICWRYDPILINQKYTVEYHIKMFESICRRLSGYVGCCIFSYIDLYKKTIRNFPDVRPVSYEDKKKLAEAFMKISRQYHIKLKTCLEDDRFLKDSDIDTGGCYSQAAIEKAIGIKLKAPVSLMTRPGCSCLLGNDIGMYNTCLHGCKYCYANEDRAVIKKNYQNHDPFSPLLIGHVRKEDIIKEAKQVSYIDYQMSLFD